MSDRGYSLSTIVQLTRISAGLDATGNPMAAIVLQTLVVAMSRGEAEQAAMFISPLAKRYADEEPRP